MTIPISPLSPLVTGSMAEVAILYPSSADGWLAVGPTTGERKFLKVSGVGVAIKLRGCINSLRTFIVKKNRYGPTSHGHYTYHYPVPPASPPASGNTMHLASHMRLHRLQDATPAVIMATTH
jgi:hypothetical protein